MAHIHDVIDTDIHYKIDGITRTITNLNETKRELVQSDHNSERFTFEIPRYVDGHDFSKCNAVQIHYANADKFDKVKNTGVYNVEDLHIKEDDDETIVLSWLISGHATETVGTLNFSIRFACVSGGKVEYAWSTTIFKGILILESLYNSDEVIVEYPDTLADLLARVNELEDSAPVPVTQAEYDRMKANGSINENTLYVVTG